MSNQPYGSQQYTSHGAPPQQQQAGGYPPQAYASQGGYGAPQGYPPQGQYATGGYAPPGGGYAPPAQYGAAQGYPPQGQYPGQGQYPPQAYASGYPPQYNTGGYPAPHNPYNSGVQGGGWYSQYYTQATQEEMAELTKWFRAVDKDGGGTITADELQNLSFGGEPLGFEIALKLIKVFDKNRTGDIDIAEYITLHKFIQAMTKSFMDADTDRSGSLDAMEIHRALLSAGFTLQQASVQAMFNKVSRTGQPISFHRFLELAANIALVRSQFEWRDTARQGRILVTLDDLLTMISDV